MNTLPSLPTSWSSLTWQQLCECWQVKQRYGGNADVARAAAFLVLALGEGLVVRASAVNNTTGETEYVIVAKDGVRRTVTPRELTYMASTAIPWFDFPYGDPGEEAVKDEKGKVIKDSRDPVRGYVSPMRDAMLLPQETIKVAHKTFALPQVAGVNLTWQQYRSLQAIAPGLFAEGKTEEQIMDEQARFLAHILTPRSIALLDTNGGSIRLRLHYEYIYNEARADGLVAFWRKRLTHTSTLFHICFQVYQTALSYYAASYPLLFQSSGKSDPLKDALIGEVGTINTIMKYAGYAEQQQVYDSNLPFVLDILNTMSKEAKEIEKIKNKTHRKK